MSRQYTRQAAERHRKSTKGKARKAEAPSSQGQQRQKQREEELRELRENVRQILDRVRHEFPAMAQLVIAAALGERGRFLAVRGLGILLGTIPGSQAVGLLLFVRGVVYSAASLAILLNLLGVFETHEDSQEDSDFPTP